MGNDAIPPRLEGLLMLALSGGATHLHLEPQADEVRIRARLEGELQTLTTWSRRRYEAVLGELHRAAPTLSDSHLPELDVIQIKIMGQEMALRLQTSPTLHGQKLVLALFKAEAESPRGLDDLGLDDGDRAEIERWLGMSRGIIFIAGTVATGRNSLINACLLDPRFLDRGALSVHPQPRFDLPGVTQWVLDDPLYQTLELNDLSITTSPVQSMAVAAALPRLDKDTCFERLRAEPPEVLYLREATDSRAMRLALELVRCCDTLVLTTLHTPRAIDIPARLFGMGIEVRDLKSVPTVFRSQRRLPALCPQCRREKTLSERAQRHMGILTASVWEAPGCTACEGGEQGFVLIQETYTPERRTLERALETGRFTHLARDAARSGMRTLRQHGLARLSRAEVSLSDVLLNTPGS